MGIERFVIFTGFWPGKVTQQALPETRPNDNDFVVCADGGYAICAAAGIRPDMVIGDFDSLSVDFVNEIEQFGIERIVLPREKDDTDTMQCVKHGLSQGFERFLIVGGIGGDFGHTIGAVQTLSFLADMGCDAEIVSGTDRLFMVDGEKLLPNRGAKPAAPAIFTGSPGMKFSVFSYAERSAGVSIHNAKYPLLDVVLTQSYPLGVHNEFINEETVTVSVRLGRLLIIVER